jgi:putative hydroxymethylpyrimidine transport system substrate-binding protein
MRGKRITGLGVVVLVALLLAGCGGGSAGGEGESGGGDTAHAARTKESPPGPTIDTRGTEKYASVWVTLDGWEGAETVSLLMAEKRGYFEKERISPLILSPVTPKRSIPYVVSGQNAFGVAHGPEAVVARDKGAPIVIVGSVVRQATAAFIWTKESGIKSIADLKGKTIAIPGLSSQQSFLQFLLAEAGLKPADVKVISVGNDLVPALVKGRADAIFGGSGNLEGIELKSRGFKPVVTPVADLGIPEYDELVLVARQDVAEANPKLMEDFVSAMGRGAAAALEQPKAAAKALDVSGESNPETSDSAMRGQVVATVGKLSDSGNVDPSRFQHLIDWMFENGMIKQDLPVEELVPKL